MSGREAILANLRRSLDRRSGDERLVELRLTEHPRGLIPKRSDLPPEKRVELFIHQAESVQGEVERVNALEDLPEAVVAYLVQHNLPPRVRLAPDPSLTALPWEEKAPLLDIAVGRAEPDDQVSLTPAYAGVAETGTLMLVSGPATPSTLNFLPETHLVILRTSQITGSYEDAWDRLREVGQGMPRTVNFITGPSRTGDIEQQIELGAHGPRRLRIFLFNDL